MMSLYSVKDNNNIYFEYSMYDALTMADFSYLLYCKICLNHMNFIVLLSIYNAIVFFGF